MGYLFGIGDGIWIGFGIILAALSLCVVSGKSKGLPSVITYSLIALLFLCTLLWWPIRSINDPPIDYTTKTDIVLIPRVIFLIFLPLFTIFLINQFVRHNLFNVVRAESTALRHGEPWIVEARMNSLR